MSELYKAMHKLQGVIRGVKRDAKNPHFKNSYATLEQVTDTIRQHMQDAGLIWFQMPGRITDGGIEVTTVIAHAESGQEIRSIMEVPLGKRDPQGAGSALTYGQRYSLMAILGLPPTDDDAETAIDRDNARPEPAKAPARVPANQLKKDGAWDKRIADFEADLADVHSLAQFDKLAKIHVEEVKAAGWPESWVTSFRDRLITERAEFIKNNTPSIGDVVADIADTFPGAKVVNEQHPLMAG